MAERVRTGALEAPAPFIVGASRSGTTLLRMMLDAHPELAIPSETHFMRDATASWERSAAPVRAVSRTLVELRNWGDFAMDAGVLQRRLEHAAPQSAGQSLRVFYKLYAEQRGKQRWGDKTPPYVLLMGVIADLLPEARFVHVIRDGRDVALSVVPLAFGPNSTEESATWWSDRIATARRQSATLEHYLEVRYEDLVLHPEGELRKVCRFIELPWDSDMLDYHRHAATRLAEMGDLPATNDASAMPAARRTRIHALLERPPEQARAGRWRREMSPSDLELFEAIAGATLQELGYELSSANSSDR